MADVKNVAISISEPETPGWWLNQLSVLLHNRRIGRHGRRLWRRDRVDSCWWRPGLDLLTDYLRGDPPLRPDIHNGWAAPFRQFLRMGRLNLAPLLVSATSKRMKIQDFRTAAASDELGDVEARNLMRRNKLLLRARQVHDDMLGLGDAYVIVTPPDENRAWSLITAESPMECITLDDPETGEPVAGLKMFYDPVRREDRAYLFLPGKVYVAKAPATKGSALFLRRPFTIGADWFWDPDNGGEDGQDVPGDKVAMVHFENADGRSEIEGHINQLDRINDKIFNEWWIGKMQAFRQRALQVDESDDYDDDDADNPAGSVSDEDWTTLFTSAPDAMWKLPANTKIWESQTTDVSNLIGSIKSDLQWLAFVASLPLYLITPEGVNTSATGATTQKEEHAFLIMDRRDRAEVGWAQVLSMAFLFQGMEKQADVAGIEVMWGPMELVSWVDRAQATAQLKGALPTEAIQTDVMGYSPADVVSRLRALRNQDLLYEVTGSATGVVPGAPVPDPTAGDGSPAS